MNFELNALTEESSSNKVDILVLSNNIRIIMLDALKLSR